MRRDELGLLALDSLCAGVLSLGAALVLLPAVGLQAEWPLMAAAQLVLLGLCALCEGRPWVPAAVMAGLALLCSAVLAAIGMLDQAIEAVGGYIAWAVGEAVAGSPQITVYLVCMLPITVIFWVLSRLGSRKKQLCLWIVTLLAGGLIGYKAACMPEGWLLPFMLIFAGMMLYLPRAGTGREGRLQAQALAVVLAVPVLGLSLLIGPKGDGEWRSKTVGYLVQDAQDFWEFHWGGLPSLPLTSMRSMGLQPENDRLGGDIELGDGTVITGDRPVLLRGRAYEAYTGWGWEDGGDDPGNFRYHSLFWSGRKNEAFGLDGPPRVNKHLLSEVLAETTVTLRTQRNYRSLYLPYRTEDVEVLRAGGDLYFDMRGEAYWNERPGGSVEYRVKASAWDYRDRDFDGYMLALEKELEQEGADPGYERAAECCLQLPESLPEWVRELGLEIAGEGGSPYGRAMALRDWLGGNCEYTLKPGPPDYDEDFVADFLTNKKGYCTYYASALTVLCRCAGIPARYVTGYGMIQDGRRYAATQGTAHAWTEIYLAHMGWVPLDALGQEIFEIERPEPLPAGDGIQGPPPTPSPTPSADGGWGAEPEEEGFDSRGLLWGMPVLLVLCWLLGAKLLRQRRYTTKYVRGRYRDASAAAEHVYAGMLRLLALRGQRPRAGETLLGFWERVGPSMDGGWREAAGAMDRLRFGGVEPGWDEAEAMCDAYLRLLRRTRKGLGVRGWFV